MTRSAPLRRPEPYNASATQLVLSGQPVSSQTWTSMGYLANWLRGKGAQLVPACFPERQITAGSTETFRFRVKTRSSAIQRVWMVALRTTAATATTAEIKAPSGTGTTVTVPVSSSLEGFRAPIVYVEDVASKAASEVEITVSIKANSNTVIVDSIGCYEQDRPVLNADATDLGVEVATLAVRQPIFEASNASAGGVYASLAGCDARRVGLFHWSVGASTLVTRSSATPANIFILDAPILTRKLARSAVTGTVKWAIYGYVSGVGSGTVTVTSTSGANDTITITNTVAAWSTAQTFDVDCDDMASDDGRQTAGSPAWDMLNFQFAGDGTRSIIVQAISVWDDS